MKLSTGWWGIGLGQYRHTDHTYELYDADGLPQLDVPAGYGWLESAEPHSHPMEVTKAPEEVVAGLPLEDFFSRPDLQEAFASPTDCYWEVVESFTPEAFGDGARLVRFLADSQGCVFWYLLVNPGGVAGPVLAGFAEEYDLVQVAASFDEFLYRYWIENSAWWEVVAECRSFTQLSPRVRDYLAHYGG
ncbi:hypothetical protein [Dactylosporangium salmoneum]|uniref:Knr4/Smi1-like domain-containing protein n=1 Tax=Dactylosporangium salmoneum TaxID=53361 RepID=A0ABP5SJ04_9ACTN